MVPGQRIDLGAQCSAIPGYPQGALVFIGGCRGGGAALELGRSASTVSSRAVSSARSTCH